MVGAVDLHGCEVGGVDARAGAVGDVIGLRQRGEFDPGGVGVVEALAGLLARVYETVAQQTAVHLMVPRGAEVAHHHAGAVVAPEPVRAGEAGGPEVLRAQRGRAGVGGDEAHVLVAQRDGAGGHGAGLGGDEVA